MIEETYMGALRNKLPAFTLFNDALGWLGAEESAELKDTVDGIKDIEAKILVSDSPIEKKRYGRMLKRLKMEEDDIKQGVKLLKGAIRKANAYNAGREVQYPRLGVVGSRTRLPRL